MKYNANQIKHLENAFKNHLNGTKEEKIDAERMMRKYGCETPAEAYNIIKEHRKKAI